MGLHTPRVQMYHSLSSDRKPVARTLPYTFGIEIHPYAKGVEAFAITTKSVVPVILGVLTLRLDEVEFDNKSTVLATVEHLVVAQEDPPLVRKLVEAAEHRVLKKYG